MALTPEEVVNKRFQPTKFREGYDQDEVDDFLDEVVNELRRLTAQNEELREKLAGCERRVSELGGEPSPVPAQAAPPERAEQATSPAAAPAAPADEASTTEPPAARTAPGQGPEAAAGMLLLAQKLHDDYVRSGEEQRDRIVGDAQEHAERLVREAEERQRETLGALERERSTLERAIEELRAFERDYRTRLRSYLESQLNELETRGAVAPDVNPAT